MKSTSTMEASRAILKRATWSLRRLLESTAASSLAKNDNRSRAACVQVHSYSFQCTLTYCFTNSPMPQVWRTDKMMIMVMSWLVLVGDFRGINLTLLFWCIWSSGKTRSRRLGMNQVAGTARRWQVCHSTAFGAPLRISVGFTPIARDPKQGPLPGFVSHSQLSPGLA